jgi:Zn-dependent protease
MRSSIRLGRLFGIEVGLHYSWFIIALLITMSLGSQFQASHKEWGSNVIWSLAILTALLFSSLCWRMNFATLWWRGRAD